MEKVDVILKGFGNPYVCREVGRKVLIMVIKAIAQNTKPRITLGEARKIVRRAMTYCPTVVQQGLSEGQAESLKAAMEAAAGDDFPGKPFVVVEIGPTGVRGPQAKLVG